MAATARLAAQLANAVLRSVCVGIQDDAGRRLQQDAIGFVQLIGVQHEDAAALVEPDLALHQRQQALDLVAQFLVVACHAVLRITRSIFKPRLRQYACACSSS